MRRISRSIRVLISAATVLAPAHGLAYSTMVDGKFAVTVEPIIGFEHVEKVAPTPHAKNRLMYGARVIAGIQVISAEAEYTRGTDRELYPEQDLTIVETADRGKFGARSAYNLGEVLRFHLRAGGQLSKITREQTQSGSSLITTDTPAVKPYAGTGLTFRLAQALYASAELVVVFNDINDLSKNEYQTTAGFQVRLP